MADYTPYKKGTKRTAQDVPPKAKAKPRSGANARELERGSGAYRTNVLGPNGVSITQTPAQKARQDQAYKQAVAAAAAKKAAAKKVPAKKVAAKAPMKSPNLGWATRKKK